MKHVAYDRESMKNIRFGNWSGYTQLLFTEKIPSSSKILLVKCDQDQFSASGDCRLVGQPPPPGHVEVSGDGRGQSLQYGQSGRE